MNRIDKCFREKKNILSIYFTAGYPALNDTSRIIRALDKHGADMIEIGMPFSDPIADGPVIQQSSKKALENGMSLKVLFEQLKNLRNLTDLPVILMGYLNPVYKMGMEKFLDNCVQCSIDGLILPDFPPEEYEENYVDMFKSHDIFNIMLITPQTSEERIRKIDSISRGFIYMVSSYSTTGVQDGFGEQQLEYFKRIGELRLQNPGLIGFGISNRKTFRIASEYASGAIVGTAFIKAVSGEGAMDQKVGEFVRMLREG
jgi:tryptophan synthase alpha chain